MAKTQQSRGKVLVTFRLHIRTGCGGLDQRWNDGVWCWVVAVYGGGSSRPIGEVIAAWTDINTYGAWCALKLSTGSQCRILWLFQICSVGLRHSVQKEVRGKRHEAPWPVYEPVVVVFEFIDQGLISSGFVQIWQWKTEQWGRSRAVRQ